jgi:uncharacterized membrane protein YfcA
VVEASSARHQRTVLLAAGALAGVFSALFGVGGGVVIVPILVTFGGYGPKRAASTSLAAIIFIAAWGTLAQGALGNVDWRAALLIGIPGMLGVALGVAIKRRISTARLSIAFAALLGVVAVLLVAQ